MYHLHPKMPDLRDPWLLPLDVRLRSFYEARAAGVECVTAIYNRPDNSTFRYRVYNIWQTLKNSSAFRLCYFYENELPRVIPLLAHTAALLLCRTSWTPGIQAAIDSAKARGVPVLFDVDDRVFDLDCLQLIASTLDVPLEDEAKRVYWLSYLSSIHLTAKQAEGFVTTNDFLGERLREKFGRPFVRIPNSLNEEQLAVSEELRRLRAETAPDGDFVMGYFSGSPSHTNDLKTALPELIELLQRHDAMKLMIAGFMELPQELREPVAAGKVYVEPFVDFRMLQVLTARVDLNIVPMVENGFTDCKSELKFFESAVVGVPTCAAPVYAYANSIRDKETGFLCAQGQWYSTISDIRQGKYDLKAINDRALDHVLKHYSGKGFLASVEAAYDRILGEAATGRTRGKHK